MRQFHIFLSTWKLYIYIYMLKLNDSCFDSIELWLFFNGEKDSGWLLNSQGGLNWIVKICAKQDVEADCSVGSISVERETIFVCWRALPDKSYTNLSTFLQYTLNACTSFAIWAVGDVEMIVIVDVDVDVDVDVVVVVVVVVVVDVDFWWRS